MKKLIRLGDITYTKGVDSLTDKDFEFWIWVNRCRGRYSKGDWGDTDAEGKTSNDRLISGKGKGVLLARYNNPTRDIYIMTEHDSIYNYNYTTIMLVEEYTCKQQQNNR